MVGLFINNLLWLHVDLKNDMIMTWIWFDGTVWTLFLLFFRGVLTALVVGGAAAGGVTAGAVLAPVAVVGVVWGLGFTGAGISAGSIGAGLMSSTAVASGGGKRFTFFYWSTNHWNIFIYCKRPKVFWIRDRHNRLSYLFSSHLNTYVMGLRSL